MNESTKAASPPPPVMGFYDGPMWASVRDRRLQLQRCDGCGTFRYPPGPACPSCLSMAFTWTPVGGGGTIISWVIFHRQYLPAYPAPYNVVAVRLDEGPIMITNLEGRTPEGSWIGERVKLVYVPFPDGSVLPRVALAGDAA